MPSAVVISRFAEEDSILGCVEVARMMAEHGTSVSLVFTHEALNALNRGTVTWSDAFIDRRSRNAVVKKAGMRGLDLADPTRDARWSDVRALVRKAADLPGLTLVACPIWADYIELGDALPHLKRVAPAEFTALLKTSTVIGGY